MNATFARKVAYNAAIIAVGAGAFIAYDRMRDTVPKQVQRLVHDAVELELQGPVSGDNGSLARRKWREATITAKANEMDPKVQFNINFFLACNLEEGGKDEEAEREFKLALSSFPPTFNFDELDNSTKNRVAVCLDRLAQREQDRANFANALHLYVEALSMLATPEEVMNADEKFLERKAHVWSVAGLLNNMSTLMYELDLKEEAKKSEELSQRLKAFVNNDIPLPRSIPIPAKEDVATPNSHLESKQ